MDTTQKTFQVKASKEAEKVKTDFRQEREEKMVEEEEKVALSSD